MLRPTMLGYVELACCGRLAEVLPPFERPGPLRRIAFVLEVFLRDVLSITILKFNLSDLDRS